MCYYVETSKTLLLAEALDDYEKEGRTLISFAYNNSTSEYAYVFRKKKNVVAIPKTDDDEKEFVERIYKLYPTKCPKRGTSTGKSHKDKDKIVRLLRMYSRDEIERVVKHEIEVKLGKEYMMNFSTFLNNFPDPACLGGSEGLKENKGEALVINGQIYK
jgi:hypothetical protein